MSILIKDGEVLDGSGESPKKSDVLIIGERITAIGDLAAYKADRIIPASGNYILPGFIDISSVSDLKLSLFNEPHQADYLKQGVTTVVCGCGGKSLAPVMYAGEIPFSNAGWQTMDEYLKKISSLRLGVNFASYAGYESLRRSITYKPRNLGVGEINILANILKSHLQSGSIGLSLGSGGFVEFDASKDEIDMVLNILAKKDKAVFVPLKAGDKPYMTLIESGITTIISELNESLKNVQAFEKLSSSALHKSLKAEFAFSFNPYPYFKSKASEFLPSSTIKTSSASIFDYLNKKRAAGFFSKKIKELNPEKTFIWDAMRKEARFLLGKSVAEFASNRGVNTEEAFAKIIDLCGPETVFLSHAENTPLIDHIISHPKSIVAGSAWSPISNISNIHAKLSEPFLAFLESAERIGMRPEAIAKKLALPARLLGFQKRGLIKENFAADIIILKNKRPEMVFVNGKLAYENGAVSENRSGKIITR